MCREKKVTTTSEYIVAKRLVDKGLSKREWGRAQVSELSAGDRHIVVTATFWRVKQKHTGRAERKQSVSKVCDRGRDWVKSETSQVKQKNRNGCSRGRRKRRLIRNSAVFWEMRPR